MIDQLVSDTDPTLDTSAPDRETFDDLGVSPQLIDALDSSITSPFPIQRLTIPPALRGLDICGKAKTGSGKTLAFGIPLVQRAPRANKRFPTALVLVPTRELALQVTTELKPLAQARDLKVAATYGGTSIDQQVRALRARVDIVVATPGRLLDLMRRGAVVLKEVQTLVIDEADHMADLGFLPQVDQILKTMKHPHQTLLFSATLDGMVDTLVQRYMHEPVFYEVQSRLATVDTMEHRFISVLPTERVKAAAHICRSADRVLVFVRTKRGADRLAQQLKREEVNAAAIHGDLNQSQRERALRDFSRGKCPVLVATNVAARGLHVEGVDLVLHFDAPEDHKTYLHRSGRTARAGEGGLVVTFVTVERLCEVKEMQNLAGINHQIVPMRHDDPRLRDLAGWEPPSVPEKPQPSPRRSRLGHRTSVGRRRRRTRR
jgi:superfamily II DNA/RNA helicase